MKTLSKFLRLLTVASLLAAPAAQAQFTYTTNNDTITITGYTGPGGLVKIPDTINGLSVTSVGDWAFANVSSLTSVTIPNSVTTIGYFAFGGCSSLTSVTIGNSATNIGDSAFYSCTSLTSVTIPNSVNTIGKDAFYGCSSLTAITVDSGNLNYSSLDGVLFDKSQTTLIQCPGAKAGTYTTPNSVATIGSDAFSACSSLTAINVDPGNPNYSSLNGVLFDKSQTTLIQCPGGKAGTYTTPDSVATIGNDAFSGCTTLTNVTIGNSVNTIGNQAFLNCSSLSSVAIGSIVYTIANDAFSGCISLTAISVDALNPVYSSLVGVLFDHSQTTLITCPEGKTGSYTIPNSVTRIGDSAFSNCESLTNITIGTSVSNIWDYSFQYCPSLTAITVAALNPNCSSLDGVLFDKTQTILIRCPEGKVGTCAIPRSVASIEGYAFSGCTSLTAISVDPLNSAFTSVDGVLFDKSRTTLLQCPPGKVGSYTIPDGVISIGELFGSSPFSGCISLTSVTFPSSVTCICSDAAAFSYCTSLTAAYFHGNQPDMGHAFSRDSNVTLYYLPGTTGWSPIVAGRPTALWLPQAQTSDASFGLRTNQFGFNITWASGMTVVVEATPTLANPTWSPLATNTLAAGSSYFSDPQWTNHPTSFYRLRMP